MSNKQKYVHAGGLWIKKKAPKKKKTYRIIDSWIKSKGAPERSEINPDTGLYKDAFWLLFEGTFDQCRDWIMDGLMSTDGAERDHYVDLIDQLECGKLELDYRRV